jgi:hypothetical protein
MQARLGVVLKVHLHGCFQGQILHGDFVDHGAATLNIMAFSMVTLSTESLFEMLSLNDTQLNNTLSYRVLLG